MKEDKKSIRDILDNYRRLLITDDLLLIYNAGYIDDKEYTRMRTMIEGDMELVNLIEAQINEITRTRTVT